MLDAQTRALVSVSNGICSTLVMLANCLKNNGALNDGQLERALQSTIDHPEAPRERLDYQIYALVLSQLEGQKPPTLRVIEGGLSDAEDVD